jgi:thiol:disulfide interchange protein DsbC
MYLPQQRFRAAETAPCKGKKTPMKRWFLAAVLAAMSTMALAQTPPAARGAVEDGIRARVEQRFNAKPDAVTRMPFGLFEIVIGTEVFYVDQEVNYAFVGRVLDAKTRDDLTAKKRDELLRVDFKSLPLDQAVKVVRGNGSRTLVTFEDPNCGFCKKLYRDIAGLKNVTIYTFLYPILSQDSFEKSRAIWCSKDRAKAWDDMMANGKAPPEPAADCKHPLQQTLELGRKLEVTGTPTLVFADGRRMPGAVPLERIEATFKEVGGK